MASFRSRLKCHIFSLAFVSVTTTLLPCGKYPSMTLAIFVWTSIHAFYFSMVHFQYVSVHTFSTIEDCTFYYIVLLTCKNTNFMYFILLFVQRKLYVCIYKEYMRRLLSLLYFPVPALIAECVGLVAYVIMIVSQIHVLMLFLCSFPVLPASLGVYFLMGANVGAAVTSYLVSLTSPETGTASDEHSQRPTFTTCSTGSPSCCCSLLRSAQVGYNNNILSHKK